MIGQRWRRHAGVAVDCLTAVTVCACTGPPRSAGPADVSARPGPTARSTAAPPTAVTASPQSARRVDQLIPKPVSVRRLAGPAFVLTRGAHIVAGRSARPVARYLAALLRPSTGYRLPVTAGPAISGDIAVHLRAGLDPAGATEHYRLTVQGQHVRIAAGDAGGLFDAVQTLRQLLPDWVERNQVVPRRATIPAVRVVDHPRFGYRGVMLDVARSFLTVAKVKRFIDAAAMVKIDYLHVHLTDDQAWRLAIHDPATNPDGLDYRALTRVGARGGADRLPDGRTLGTGPAHRGYYTQDEYGAIVRYAHSRHITVVPEVDGPAHTNAALASIPALDGDGRAAPMNNTSAVGYSSLDMHLPATREFLRTVWRQIAALTPGPHLHVGGDEAHSTSAADYRAYVRTLLRIVAATGKRPIGWNEYAAVRLPADAVVQYWRGPLPPLVRQTRHGVRVLMSPAGRTYLDQKYDSTTRLGLTWACRRACTAARYYAWNPVRGGLRETDVVGVEAPLWSETVRGLAQAEYLAFPRLIATAEIGWTPQTSRSTPDFLRRLGSFEDRLTLAGVNFHASKPVH